MSNNLDMGGFGASGLPLRQALNGAVSIDGSLRLGFVPIGPYSAQLQFIPATGTGVVFSVASNGSAVYVASVNTGTSGLLIRPNGTHFAANGQVAWTNATNNPSTTIDLYLERDASGVLCQRNGTNAQAARIYGTYTDASNYVRASLSATSTAVTLAAETAGTGADDVPVIITPAGAAQVEVGNGVQFTEMTAPSAPAANKAILFAQDNGAGKTQLMAQFASGAAQQVAIEP